MAQDRTDDSSSVPNQSWRLARTDATVVSLVVLGLFYYWFAVADRYTVFLYGHTASGLSVAQPFDEATSSRYWMAGLVAAGIVLVLYVAASWLRGVIAGRRKATPACATWWRVWLLSAVPIALGIPVITMTMNSPTLPLGLALACLTAALLGLAVALLPGEWAARRPMDLLWLTVEGLGLVPPLVLLHAVEFAASSESRAYILFAVLAVQVVGVLWLAVVGVLRRWRGRASPNAGAILLAGLALSYTLLPLAHYAFFAPAEWRYISTASNFFASYPLLQLAAFALAAAMAWGETALRRRFGR